MLNGLKDEDGKMSEERDIFEKIQFIRRDRFNRYPQMTDSFTIRIYAYDITKSPKEMTDTLTHMYKEDTYVDIVYDDFVDCVKVVIAGTVSAQKSYTLDKVDDIKEYVRLAKKQ